MRGGSFGSRPFSFIGGQFNIGAHAVGFTVPSVIP